MRHTLNDRINDMLDILEKWPLVYYPLYFLSYLVLLVVGALLAIWLVTTLTPGGFLITAGILSILWITRGDER